MGSDRLYPEEAPVHRVSVDGFWMSATTVTNARFAAFVESTGYRTVAERPLDPQDFPGAPAENLVPGSLVFTMTAGPVDLRHLSQWWTWISGACWHDEAEGHAASRQTPVARVDAGFDLDHPSSPFHVRPSSGSDAEANGGIGDQTVNRPRSPITSPPSPGGGTRRRRRVADVPSLEAL